MKKYYLMIALLLGLSLQSCNDDQNVPAIQSKTAQKINSWNQLQKQLKALDMKYVHKKSVRRLPGLHESLEVVPSYNDWDLIDMGFNWVVGISDALGALDGGFRLKELGPWGVLAGVLIVGGLRSLETYLLINYTQTVINTTNPFVYVPQENRFVISGVAPIGSEIGELHNCLVKEVLNNENITLQNLYEYMYTTNFTTLSTRFTPQQILEIQSYMIQCESEITNFQLEEKINMLSQECTDEMNVIKYYAYVVSHETEPFDMYQYTRDFMMLVDEAYQNDFISEESALMVNGVISTLFCSKTAWNYIQPDPYQTTQYVVNTDDRWCILGQDQLNTVLASGDTINFVGYPYFDNDTLKRIYVYANNAYNVNYANDSVMQILFDGLSYENTVSSVLCSGINLYNTSIPTGSYPIYPAQGYDDYIYIDLQ